jgi:hypothetical protein
MELYNYNNENNNIDFEIKIDLHKDEGIADNLRKFILIYESPYNSPIEINNNIYAELFIKDNFFIKPVNFASETFEESSKNLIVSNFKYFNKNIPLLIFLHGFSTKDEKLKNYYKFISSITNSDIACLFINLPFHLNRRPVNEASGERLIYYDDVDTLLFFHQCVVDIKKSIDIINNILSPSEINICGISLGSMVSVITMAVDNRINKGILILGGGNWEEIHWNGILKFILKGNCAGDEKISREKCHNYYLNFPEFVKKLKTVNPDKITTEIDENFELKNLCTKKCYLCDPLAFAYKINPQKVLMINSKIDHFFSKKSTLQLWKELGKPEIHWYVYPHLSMIINKKEIFHLILKFLTIK